ncbi:hypothetical protein ASE09_33450 [Streptomyces sp. Root66D1]|nr:hypothetical protein ASD33_33470 [Streptomyces sp. Root1304]KRA85925.1 hypothetical protein ASE09_33450 [Streptomyces sp. Root66D1]
MLPAVATAGYVLPRRSQSPGGGSGIQPQPGAFTSSSYGWSQAPGRWAHPAGEIRMVSAGKPRHSLRIGDAGRSTLGAAPFVGQ